MGSYIARRLCLSIVGLLVASFIVFGLLRLLPGDVTVTLLNGINDPKAQALLRKELGLDRPLPSAYASWLTRALTGDLGKSLITGEPVAHMIRQRIAATAELGALSFVISIMLAVPIGLTSASKRGSFLDNAGRAFSILMLSIPFFWVLALVVTLPSRLIGWTVPFGYVPVWQNPIRNLSVLLIPAFLMGMNQSGAMMRLLRSTTLEVLKLDYIRTARAKGLRERRILLAHAMRNALIPVVTFAGLQVTFLLGGAVIVEQAFAIPGMGRLMFDALNQRDYNVAIGVTMVFAICILVVNLIVDLSYGYLNPRIR